MTCIVDGSITPHAAFLPSLSCTTIVRPDTGRTPVSEKSDDDHVT